MAAKSDPGFQPSRLGTKQYWDDVYSRELDAFRDDSDDEGEIWFGVEAVDKMVSWCQANVPPSSAPYVLEIGSGNGTLSIALAEAGYVETRIQGIDYSEDSVRLARAVASHRKTPDVVFTTCDFLTEDPMPLLEMGRNPQWDLILDKGTYDAIALAEKDADGVAPVDKYPGRVIRLLKPGGFFLITSCNFTEEELKQRFASEPNLTYHSNIPHKTYTYGGKTGSIIVSVAFQKSS